MDEHRQVKMSDARIRVLVVDENSFLCDVFTAVLEYEADIRVIASTNSVSEALGLAVSADVVLVNIHMSNGGALKLIYAIYQAGLPAKVLVLGMTESKEQVLRYIQAGAAGYVLKDESVEDLLKRIRDATAGEVDVSPWIASVLMSRLNKYSQMLNQVQHNGIVTADLTSREQEIINWIGHGYTNQQIASRLVIEEGTVKNHVHNILQKMGVNTRREAAATWAVLRTKAGPPPWILE